MMGVKRSKQQHISDFKVYFRDEETDQIEFNKVLHSDKFKEIFKSIIIKYS